MSQPSTPNNPKLHDPKINGLDHIVRLKTLANFLVEYEFDQQDDFDSIQELIETADEIGQLLACYRKHELIKAGDRHRFKQYCPLCNEHIFSDCPSGSK